MIHHVLVPLDGSQLAETALPIARQVVKTNGRITLVTAVEDDSAPESALSRAEDYMEHTASDLKLRGYEVEIEIINGQPAEVIIQLAEKYRVDMVIMSTHGRSGLRRVLFGSITLKVLEESLVPVLVVPSRQREETPDTEVQLGPSLAT